MSDSAYVTVNCRHGSYPGRRIGRAAAYEFELHDRRLEDAPPMHQRVFLLLDEGIQLNQPGGWPDWARGWWYCDLVEITETDGTIDVIDHFVDIVVPETPANPYRVLDLHEFGEALATGRLSMEQGVTGLTKVNHFLETRLNKKDGPYADLWPAFPPAEIEPLRDTPLVAD